MTTASLFQRSSWLLKGQGQGQSGQAFYQPPPQAGYLVSPSDTDRGSITNVRYPITVTDHPNSDYVRCYRSAERFDMCEKFYGCCSDGCCPKDEWWMAGVYVLIAFVIAVAIISVIVGVICYQRSSNRKRKERIYYSTSGSAVGSHPYESEIGSRRSVAAPY